MSYGDFKDLPRRAALINYYVIKHLILIRIQNTMDINVDCLQSYFTNLDKKSATSDVAIKNEVVSNQ